MGRAAFLARQQQFDVVVIGAGATGCAVARDAALRGLKVLLLDRGDIASGTSSGSSRMIHGGLRYLMRGQLGLVRVCLNERTTLCHLAPHLVRRAPFVIALSRPGWREKYPVRFGLALARWLSDGAEAPSQVIDHAGLEKMLPAMATENLFGGLQFEDCVTRDGRLCLEVALGARDAGATIATYVEVLGIQLDDGRAVGVRIRDRLDGEEASLACRSIVQTLGPWTGALSVGGQGDAPKVAPARGTHVAVPAFIPADTVLAALHPVDGRYVWAVGMDRYTWLGTTDEPQPDDPDRCRPNDEEITYLLTWLANYTHAPVGRVYLARAALRPLVRATGRSRDFRCGFSDAGVLVVAGGKITTARAMAEETVDRLLASPRLAGVATKPCSTKTVLLPGAPPVAMAEWMARHREVPLASELRDHLLYRYGGKAPEIFARIVEDARLGEPVHAGRPEVMAEIDHAVAHEWARSLSDVMWRRTELAFTADNGVSAVPAVIARMTRLLGWTPLEGKQQQERYEAEVEAAVAPLGHPVPVTPAPLPVAL
jgi:glycerol-3-phosphate dehydrogenase